MRHSTITFRIQSGSLICSYSYVMNSFWYHRIRFLFVMFSPDEHIRQVFVRICQVFAIRSRYVTSICYSVKAYLVP